VPRRRQTLFFSATMPAEIRRLAESILHDPVSVRVAPVASTADGISQSVYLVAKRDKPALLERLIREDAMDRTLIFTRTKCGTDKLVRGLRRSGIDASAIHGNKSQGARTRALGHTAAVGHGQAVRNEMIRLEPLPAESRAAWTVRAVPAPAVRRRGVTTAVRSQPPGSRPPTRRQPPHNPGGALGERQRDSPLPGRLQTPPPPRFTNDAAERPRRRCRWGRADSQGFSDRPLTARRSLAAERP
jgi:hypothetical protein